MKKPILLFLLTSLVTLSAQAKDPATGATTFTVYEAYLSPQQEGEEEDGAPKGVEPKSTPPFTPREQRKSRGHGQIRFNRELSRAFVDVEIAGVNPADIVMFHIHCGPPGMLGPILVDLGSFGDLKKAFANNKLAVEVSNKDVKFVSMYPKAVKLPESCPAELGIAGAQVKTIAGMEALARKGALYFNLHTKTHTFYGEMRGQVYPARE